MSNIIKTLISPRSRTPIALYPPEDDDQEEKFYGQTDRSSSGFGSEQDRPQSTTCVITRGELSPVPVKRQMVSLGQY